MTRARPHLQRAGRRFTDRGCAHGQLVAAVQGRSTRGDESSLRGTLEPRSEARDRVQRFHGGRQDLLKLRVKVCGAVACHLRVQPLREGGGEDDSLPRLLRRQIAKTSVPHPQRRSPTAARHRRPR